MKEVLMPITILGSFGAAVYFFTKVMTDYLLRKKMIDKGLVGEDAQSLFKVQEGTTNKYSSLKWGLLVLFAGISLIVMEFVPYYGNSPLPYGLFAVSVSLGFLIYYFIVRRESKKALKLN